ncbi:hypothetical protein QAD02_000230 [Eretmocerus hayati]|uniref:Uncharacterized protein n=1 Tax=Eretmocerus hayati TaxID=131215 RepID=A0ACC2NDJ8_9HYME|nr:hypothetical protein QAD02_000230 [Eretmocerus hayati]
MTKNCAKNCIRQLDKGLAVNQVIEANDVASDGPSMLRQQPNDPFDASSMEEAFVDSFVNSISPVPESGFSPVEIGILAEQDVGFLLFTSSKQHDPVVLKIGDRTLLRSSNFSHDRPTKIIVHGWSDSGSTPWLHDMRKSYLISGGYNVIIVDWASGASKDYLVSSRMTRQVGDYIAQMIEFLLKEGYLTSMDQVHILGHSLGAQAAGFAGSKLSGEIGRITGMDPARPEFEAPLLRELKDRLDSSDAKFVDVIHTCAGTVGFVRPVGHVDFYPNGGSFRQPGCPILMTQYCSHARSHQFMTESILNTMGFPALQCDGWREFQSHKCILGANRIVFMGERLDPAARGVYFLATNAEPPYGKGQL